MESAFVESVLSHEQVTYCGIFLKGGRSPLVRMTHEWLSLFVLLIALFIFLLLPLVVLKAGIIAFLSGTNFKSSESSWLSLVGVVLIPLFLARGHPDRLKTESMELIT